MSVWGALYRAKCGLWRYQGMNEYGEASYAPALDAQPEPFFARVEHSRKEVLDKGGERVLSEAYLLTETELRPLDRIRADEQEWEVKSVSPIRDMLGDLDHYEAVL